MRHQHIRSIKKIINEIKPKYESELEQETLKEAMKRIHIYREIEVDKLTRRHVKKLEELIRKQKKPQRTLRVFPKPVPFINTSGKSLSTRDVAILEMGPKYIFQQKPRLVEIIPQIESIMTNVEWPHKEPLRAEIALRVEKELRKGELHTNLTLKRIREIKKDPSIAITMTDKSNKIIIMDRREYDKKMIVTIQDMKCREIEENPLDSLTKKVHELSKKGIWPNDHKPFFTNYFEIPNIIGKIKDHKEGNPIRPIVAKYSAPTYQMEKVCASILKGILPPTERVITSTMDFIRKMKNIGIRKNEQMISLDVVKLYPSIDLTKAEALVHEAISNESQWSIENKDTMKRAISLILRNNYFKFKDRIYIQETGAPMGSSISGVLAEFIMRPLEENIISKYSHIRIWYRYADDVYMIWSNSHNFEEFLTDVNDMDSHIKFTHEKEKKRSINYLDLTLTHHKGRITRDIYRKPTATNAIIPTNAFTLARYKMSAINHMINRALTYCSKCNLKKEMERIFEITERSGYGRPIVKDAIRKIKRKMKQPIQEKEDQRIAGTMEYYKGITEPILRIMNKYNVKIAVKNTQKMPNVICNIKPPIDMMDRRGIYKIPYHDEEGKEKAYIGQTKRKLFIRKTEHFKDIATGKKTTALAKANLAGNIDIDFAKTTIIAPYTNKIGTLTRESLEICRAGQEVCNYQDSFNIPPIWRNIYSKSIYNERNKRAARNNVNPQRIKVSRDVNNRETSSNVSIQTPPTDGNTVHVPEIPDGDPAHVPEIPDGATSPKRLVEHFSFSSKP